MNSPSFIWVYLFNRMCFALHPIKNQKRLRDNRNPDYRLCETYIKHIQTKIIKGGCIGNYGRDGTGYLILPLGLLPVNYTLILVQTLEKR